MRRTCSTAARIWATAWACMCLRRAAGLPACSMRADSSAIILARPSAERWSGTVISAIAPTHQVHQVGALCIGQAGNNLDCGVHPLRAVELHRIGAELCEHVIP